MIADVETLQAEVAWLRGQLDELRGGPDDLEKLRKLLGAAGQPLKVVSLLLRAKRVVSCEAIYAQVLEKPNGDGPNERAIAVIVCHARAALRKVGAPGDIRNRRAVGYEMTPDLRQWLNAKLEAVQ